MGCQQTRTERDLMIGSFDEESARGNLNSVSSAINSSESLMRLLGETRVVKGPWGIQEIRDIHADKVVVVLSGRLHVLVGKDQQTLSSGETVVIPQGVAASYRVAAVNKAKILVLTVPAAL